MVKPIRVSTERCNGCKSCALVCSLFKTGTIRPKAAGVVIRLNQFKKEETPVLCRQCKNPKCVEACPTGSLIQETGGVVLVDKNKCTGCWACVDACPFDAMNTDPIENTVVKCDLCHGHQDGPRCVSICPVQALTLPVSSVKPEN